MCYKIDFPTDFLLFESLNKGIINFGLVAKDTLLLVKWEGKIM